MKSTRRERRDLFLVILIVPIGILCMLTVGQFAIRMLPRWNIAADMGSNVDPNKQYASFQEIRVVEPLLSAIQTPPSWRDTFLTPQAGQENHGVVPLATFDPSVTPSPEVTVSETATQVATASPSVTASFTPVPTNTTAIPTSGTGTATASVTPPTAPATRTKNPDPTDPPPGDPPTATSPPPTPPPPIPSPSVVTSTIVPAMSLITPQPAQVNIGAPDNNFVQTSQFPDGSYYVVNLPITVQGPAYTNYDLAYYEVENPPGNISMDQVILGITNDNTWQSYYQVFYWGDFNRDQNSNVDTNLPAIPDIETDNAQIPVGSLYQDPASPGSPQTGILIDVDNAPSNPPVGTYQWIVVIAPRNSPAGNSTDGGQTDAIQLVDVARPAPPALPSMSMFSAEEDSSIQSPPDPADDSQVDSNSASDASPPTPAESAPADTTPVDSNSAGDASPPASEDIAPTDSAPADTSSGGDTSSSAPADSAPADTTPAVDLPPAP